MYPNPDRATRPGTFPPPWGQPAEPGPIPLRPLLFGEILGVALGITRRHWIPIGVVGAVFALLSSAATLIALSATGTLETYASATWVNDVLAGRTTMPPTGMLIGLAAGLLVSTTGGVVLSGMAAAYAGADALGRLDREAAVDRLRGRWPVLLLTGVVVAVACTAGLALFVVPGVLAYLVLVLAGPVVIMERAPLPVALRRSIALTTGHRGRIFGLVLVSTLLAGIASAVVVAILTSLVTSVVSSPDAVTGLLISDALTAIVAMFTATYLASVVAVVYVEIRVRAEGLGQSLRAAAAADPRSGRPPSINADRPTPGAPPTG
jgi:hypothetical protein